MTSKGILPKWVKYEQVESERAVDALGLQRYADEIASYILPGFSVATWRARYLSFFCWVRHRIEPGYSEHKIRQWEVALALAENNLHGDDNRSCPYVGSRAIKDHARYPRRALARPEGVMKTPAWKAYRPMLIDLGLIDDTVGKWRLTQEGLRLASVYGGGKDVSRLHFTDKACLSNISSPERKILRSLIGLNGERRNYNESFNHRVSFIKELRRRFSGNKVPDTGRLLRVYEKMPGSRNKELMLKLHAASVWEWLSLGLNALFVLWVKAIENNADVAFKHRLGQALGVPNHMRKTLKEVNLRNELEAIGSALSAVRQALCVIKLSNPVLDADDWFDLASDLVNGRQRASMRVNSFLDSLAHRHLSAKGEDAWIYESTDGHGWKLVERQADLPSVVQLHSYRMAAFQRIVNDLGGLHV